MPTTTKRRPRRPWTPTNIRELKMHSKQETPVDKVARRMNRTQGSIRQQAFALRIPIGHRRQKPRRA